MGEAGPLTEEPSNEARDIEHALFAAKRDLRVLKAVTRFWR
jgi:hypothetical protein